MDRGLPKSSLEHQAHFGWISRHSSHEVALPLVHMLRPASRGRSTQSPRRQAYSGAGAHGMVGRLPQRRRGRCTPRGPAAGAGAGALGPRAGGRSRMPRAQLRLKAPALARAPPPPSVLQRSRPSPGTAAALAGRPGRLECRRSGRPRRAAPGRGGAGSAPRPRLGLLDAPSAEAPPRAGTLCPSPPPLPFLPPARQGDVSQILPKLFML